VSTRGTAASTRTPILSVHPVFRGRTFPSGRRLCRRESRRPSRHTPRHSPNIQYPIFNIQYSIFPFTPAPFRGRGADTTSGAGLRGSVLSVDSVADLGWGGGQRCPFNHLPRNSRKNHSFYPAETSRILSARSAAFLAFPMPTVATGHPGGS